jgi:Golgi nucleoside diphosphatase
LENFGGTSGKALHCYKWNIMADSSGSSDDQNTNRNVDSKDCAHEVSDGNRTLMDIGLWAIYIAF